MSALAPATRAGRRGSFLLSSERLRINCSSSMQTCRLTDFRFFEGVVVRVAMGGTIPQAILVLIMTPTEKIWHNGRFIKWEDATIHVLSHVVHYGSSVFEGIRCYSTPNGPAVFRLREHVRRMVDSAKIYRMDLGYSAEELSEAMLELVRVNQMEACY